MLDCEQEKLDSEQERLFTVQRAVEVGYEQ
jgi:hypothetical protein